MGEGPSVYTVPAGTPFLPALVDALLAGRFGALDPDDPLALAGVTILLPTRRSARALTGLFLARSGGVTALPQIRPIGDVDEDEHLLAPESAAGADRLVLPAAVPRLERLLTLTELVLAWKRTVRREMLALAPGEALLVPASAADAVRLSGDLARLMDEMATAGLDWSGLAGLVPDDYPAFWGLTIDFLKIASEAWPAHLAAAGLADPAARRDVLIRSEAARLGANPPSGPVIAAGSTGSIPATAELLATIARLPSGAVVLPGLDQRLDAAAWAAIGAAGEAGAPGHPQYGLKQLLAALGIDRDAVEPLAGEARPGRDALLSEAMRPAETTEFWHGAAPPAAALDGVALVVARHEQEEAVAAALALRQALDDGLSSVALVTPDRGLARRVAAELGRWGLVVDDSAGAALDGTPPAVFARLLAEAALSEAEPVALLALAKHPLAAFGLDRPSCRRAARALELALFRGARIAGGLAGLPAALAAARQAVQEGGRRVAPSRRRLDDEDWALAFRLAEALVAVLSPLAGGFGDAGAASTALTAALRQAAADETGRDDALWEGPAGEALAALVVGLSGPKAGRIALDRGEYPPFLLAAMQGVRVTRPPAADPRIHIWGTLEARLQPVDLMVLGGLDEGVWPAEVRTDPWLSRGMRAGLGLEPPERRIGQSAHDFVQAMGAARVVVTRAEKRGGAPTVASRWLQRLLAMAPAGAADAAVARGRVLLDWARALDRAGAAAPVSRPEPAPPVALRPRRLSVTEIETLVRDPYAIYARHVLRLSPLDPLGTPPDAAMRGNLVHDTLATFCADWQGGYDAAAERRLLEIGRELFRPLEAFPDVHVLWWLRCEAIARWFVGWEGRRGDEIAVRHAEIAGELEVAAPAGPFHLRGRADRIDLRHDGRIDILDFKTGTPPSARQVLRGLAPQLALEAAMVRAGAFGEAFAGREVATLAWLGVGKAGRGEPFQSAVEKGWTADALAETVLARLHELIAAYDRADQAYPSQPHPQFERRFAGDYDHLARVGEWRLAEAEEGE